jgi:hypothetical protein
MPSSSEPGPWVTAPCLPSALLAAALLGGLPWACAQAQQVRLLVQDSPLAGYNYHEAARAFAAMRVGDELVLVREPDNPHDSNAVRVEWQSRKLGYVPRARNAALAWALDQGEAISARISSLQRHRSPGKRVSFEVYMH